MKKQSSIEYLYERLERMMPRTSMYNIDKEDYFNQAKQMHKQEIIDAHESGVDSVEHGYGLDYYNETFKSE